MPIRIKPHHFVDVVTSIGRGQREFEPHPYGHAVHTVSRRLLLDPDTLLEMELGADDICAPCVHNVDGLCDDTIDTSFRPAAPASKREYNMLNDERWCQCMALAQGDRLTAREFCRRVQQCGGDLAAIYRESPADRVADRLKNLRAGVAEFTKLTCIASKPKP